MNRPVAFIDLDGVLVDFVAGAKAAHGKDIPHRDCRWGLEEQFGLTKDEFWAPLDYNFWVNLPWTEEGYLLLSGVETIFGDQVVLMTSPCDAPGGVEGKVKWIKKNLPRYSKKFFVGPPKHLAAGPGKILIDDHEVNTDQFVTHGGRALLVPRPWNRRRMETDKHGNFQILSVLGELGVMVAQR